MLKVEEGLHLPAAFRDLETLLHGHFPATDERTGLVLVIAYRRGHAERVQRAVGPAARRAAPRHPHGGDRHAGRRAARWPRSSRAPAASSCRTTASCPASLESLLSTALALQHLTLGLVHAAGTNPDLIRREEDAYREAAALSRPEGG